MNEKTEKKEKKKSGKGRFLKSFLLLVVTCGAVVFLPTTLIFLIGMVPTAVAAFANTTNERTAMITVGGTNFAGLLPAMITLWQGAHTVENAISIVSQPIMLLYMYGGAGIGALLYFNIPPLTAGYLKRRGQRRQRDIVERMNELVAEWGVNVSGNDQINTSEKNKK